MKKTQCQRILDRLIEANGDWISAQVFIREMWLTQTAARIVELKRKGHNIETSDFRDEYRFCSYRLPVEPKQEKLI